MNEFITSLKINAEMTDEERKEIEKIYDKVLKRIETESQTQDCDCWSCKKLKSISDKMNENKRQDLEKIFIKILGKNDTENQHCTCDDYDNEPPTFEYGIIYAYENVIEMLIEKIFE